MFWFAKTNKKETTYTLYRIFHIHFIPYILYIPYISYVPEISYIPYNIWVRKPLAKPQVETYADYCRFWFVKTNKEETLNQNPKENVPEAPTEAGRARPEAVPQAELRARHGPPLRDVKGLTSFNIL